VNDCEIGEGLVTVRTQTAAATGHVAFSQKGWLVETEGRAERMRSFTLSFNLLMTALSQYRPKDQWVLDRRPAMSKHGAASRPEI
jgi:hypothetical protein